MKNEKTWKKYKIKITPKVCGGEKNMKKENINYSRNNQNENDFICK